MKNTLTLLPNATTTLLLILIGIVSPTFRSHTQTPPEITKPPADTFAFTGEKTRVTVTASGSPPLLYQWLLNGESVPAATNRTYRFSTPPAARSDAWRVIVANDFGSVTSSAATITVLPMVTNGPVVTGLEAWDKVLPPLMRGFGVSGGQLAVVREGRLVFARSYGYADIRRAQPLYPDTLMRIQSLSKAITGTAIMRLVEEGKLSLTNLAFPFLGYEAPVYPGSTNDPRLAKITIRHLMQHAGGWDIDTAVNPLGVKGFIQDGWPNQVVRDLYPNNSDAKATSMDIVRWMMGKPLQFEPGRRFSYGNLRFLVLGRVIEKATGKSYEAYVRELLAQVGATWLKLTEDLPDRGPWTLAGAQEAFYFASPTEPLLNPANLIKSEVQRLDLSPVYRVQKRNRDSGVGWAISAIDYLRFTTGIDGLSTTPDLLNTNSLQTIQKESVSKGYFAGWYPESNLVPDWYHEGNAVGTLAYCWMRSDKTTFVVIFNSHPESLVQVESTLDSLSSSFPNNKWPPHDLFDATLSYDAWKARHFSPDELGKPDVSGDFADPDGDGRPNLAEYAFHRNPRAPESEPDLQLVSGDGGVGAAPGISFRRLMLGHELGYFVEVSSDLKTWSGLDASSSPQILNADGSVQVVVRDSQSAASTGTRFYRVRVMLSPHQKEPLYKLKP